MSTDKPILNVVTTIKSEQAPDLNWKIRNFGLFLQSPCGRLEQTFGPVTDDRVQLKITLRKRKTPNNRDDKLKLKLVKITAANRKRIRSAQVKGSLQVASDADWTSEFAIRPGHAHLFVPPASSFEPHATLIINLTYEQIFVETDVLNSWVMRLDDSMMMGLMSGPNSVNIGTQEPASQQQHDNSIRPFNPLEVIAIQSQPTQQPSYEYAAITLDSEEAEAYPQPTPISATIDVYDQLYDLTAFPATVPPRIDSSSSVGSADIIDYSQIQEQPAPPPLHPYFVDLDSSDSDSNTSLFYDQLRDTKFEFVSEVDEDDNFKQCMGLAKTSETRAEQIAEDLVTSTTAQKNPASSEGGSGFALEFDELADSFDALSYTSTASDVSQSEPSMPQPERIPYVELESFIPQREDAAAMLKNVSTPSVPIVSQPEPMVSQPESVVAEPIDSAPTRSAPFEQPAAEETQTQQQPRPETHQSDDQAEAFKAQTDEFTNILQSITSNLGFPLRDFFNPTTPQGAAETDQGLSGIFNKVVQGMVNSNTPLRDFGQKFNEILSGEFFSELTPYQMTILRNEFNYQQNPDRESYARLMEATGLSKARIQAWFQMRRITELQNLKKKDNANQDATDRVSSEDQPTSSKIRRDNPNFVRKTNVAPTVEVVILDSDQLKAAEPNTPSIQPSAPPTNLEPESTERLYPQLPALNDEEFHDARSEPEPPRDFEFQLGEASGFRLQPARENQKQPESVRSYQPALQAIFSGLQRLMEQSLVDVNASGNIRELELHVQRLRKELEYVKEQIRRVDSAQLSADERLSLDNLKDMYDRVHGKIHDDFIMKEAGKMRARMELNEAIHSIQTLGLEVIARRDLMGSLELVRMETELCRLLAVLEVSMQIVGEGRDERLRVSYELAKRTAERVAKTLQERLEPWRQFLDLHSNVENSHRNVMEVISGFSEKLHYDPNEMSLDAEILRSIQSTFGSTQKDVNYIRRTVENLKSPVLVREANEYVKNMDEQHNFIAFTLQTLLQDLKERDETVRREQKNLYRHHY